MSAQSPRRDRGGNPNAPVRFRNVPLLTDAELHVLRSLANGEGVAASAARLHLSPSTIRKHRYRINRALGVRSTVHAVALAMASAQILPSDIRNPGGAS